MADYLEIVGVTGPSEAAYGAQVTLYVSVKNIWNQGIQYASVTGVVDGIEVQCGVFTIYAGETLSIPFRFTMPNKSVVCNIATWWQGTDGVWYADDTVTYSVALTGAPASIDGEIRNVRVKLGSQYYTPPTQVPQGEQVRVYFDGRNLSSDSAYLYGSIRITKPSGSILYSGGDWSALAYAPGTDHEFIFPGPTSQTPVLDEVGRYNLDIWLYAKVGSTTELVDSYSSYLTVAEAPPEEYTGRIENPRIKWGGTAFPTGLYKSIPQTIPYGDYFRVGFTGRNTSDVNVKLWGSVKIYRPNGTLAWQGEDTESLYTGPNGTHDFEFPVPSSPAKQVDAYGDWKATIELRASSASGELLDTETMVKIFSTTEEPPDGGYDGEIRNPRVRECNGTWKSMDGAEPTIQSGSTIQIYFDGRNLCGCMAAMHGWVTVASPSGATVLDAFDDNTVIVSDGADHHFTFPSTYTCSLEELNETGKYKASVILKAEHDGVEEEVDRQDYYFKVSGEPGDGGEPSGKAEITAKTIDYELIGAGVPFPTTEPVPVPEHARISVIAVTRSEERERLACEVWIYSPSSEIEPKYHFQDTSAWPCCDPDAAHEFIFPSAPGTFVIDELGQWDIKIHITDASDEELLTKYEGLFFNGEEKPGSTWGMIAELMPLMMIMMMFAMMVPMMRDMTGELEAGYE